MSRKYFDLVLGKDFLHKSQKQDMREKNRKFGFTKIKSV